MATAHRKAEPKHAGHRGHLAAAMKLTRTAAHHHNKAAAAHEHAHAALKKAHTAGRHVNHEFTAEHKKAGRAAHRRGHKKAE